MHGNQLLHLSLIFINQISDIFRRLFCGTSLLVFGELNHIISTTTFLNVYIRLSIDLSITLLIT